jgi:hypothetical protein
MQPLRGWVKALLSVGGASVGALNVSAGILYLFNTGRLAIFGAAPNPNRNLGSVPAPKVVQDIKETTEELTVESYKYVSWFLDAVQNRSYPFDNLSDLALNMHSDKRAAWGGEAAYEAFIGIVSSDSPEMVAKKLSDAQIVGSIMNTKIFRNLLNSGEKGLSALTTWVDLAREVFYIPDWQSALLTPEQIAENMQLFFNVVLIANAIAGLVGLVLVYRSLSAPTVTKLKTFAAQASVREEEMKEFHDIGLEAIGDKFFHELCSTEDVDSMSVVEFRKQMLGMRKRWFRGRKLLAVHFVRPNGTLRETPLEICRALGLYPATWEENIFGF